MKILIIKEKYQDRYFKADTKEKLNSSAEQIIKERLEMEWYDKKAKESAESILASGNPMAFLYSRKSYEYEDVELVETEN